MRRNGLKLLGMLALVGALGTACADQTPTGIQPTAAALKKGESTKSKDSKDTSTEFGTTGTASGDTVLVLDRTDRIREYQVSATITQLGGTIEIPEAGFKIEFPVNALPREMKAATITVTALAGTSVAYEMEPHGLAFRAPVIVKQDLKYTTAYKKQRVLERLEGVYHVDPIVQQEVLGLEFRPTELDIGKSKVTFTIDHFSGYLLAQGRKR